MTIFGFNWIDGIIILFLAFYLYGRRRQGFIYGILDLIGFSISLLLGLKFYQVAGGLLQAHVGLPRGIANAVGFLLISFISEPILYLLFLYLSRFIPQHIIQSSLNKRLFFIPTLISGLILIAFLTTACLSLPVRPDIKQAITESRIGGYITDETTGLEKYLSDIFGGAVQDSLNFLTVEPKGEESVNLNFTKKDVTVDTASENTMLSLVNYERTSRGLPALISDSKLQSVGRAHCTDMFARGYFSHYTPDGKSPFDRMDAAGILYTAAGENLAYAPTVQIAHKGLMQSPGHRANILSKDFGKVGIGVIDGGIYGKMFCQEFTN